MLREHSRIKIDDILRGTIIFLFLLVLYVAGVGAHSLLPMVGAS